MVPVFFPDCDCDCHDGPDHALALRLARKNTVAQIEAQKAQSAEHEERSRKRTRPWFFASLGLLSVVLLSMAFAPDLFLGTASLFPLGFLLPLLFAVTVVTAALFARMSRTDDRFLRTCDLAIELRKSADDSLLSRTIDLGPGTSDGSPDDDAP